MSHEELISRDVLLVELRTSIRISQTSPYLLPSPGVRDIVPKPLGKPIKPILSIGPTRHRIASIRPCNSESEDEQHKDQDDEGCHAEKVESQETLFVKTGTNKASKRDKQHESTKNKDWPAKRVDALVVWL